MAEHRRARLAATGTLVVIFAVIAMAFILGGSHSSSGESAGGAGAPVSSSVQRGEATSAGVSHGAKAVAGGEGNFAGANSAAGAVAAPAVAPQPSSATGGSVAGGQIESSVDSVTATRVVKNGNLDLRVPRGQVQATVTKLVNITTGLNGYVSQSRTETVQNSPEGEVTLRIPAGSFDGAVTQAEALGRVMSLTTNARDVTGQYVDLGARLAALQRTRSTYLTILGRATTIGSTLEVQQRVNDVQQQIEELQGQLKVLRNQSADGTLSVDVTQVGAAVPVHHPVTHNGIGAAWHRSISRFARGFDAIVGALGPLLLAVLVLGLLAGIGVLGYRGVRRATTTTS